MYQTQANVHIQDFVKWVPEFLQLISLDEQTGAISHDMLNLHSYTSFIFILFVYIDSSQRAKNRFSY